MGTTHLSDVPTTPVLALPSLGFPSYTFDMSPYHFCSPPLLPTLPFFQDSQASLPRPCPFFPGPIQLAQPGGCLRRAYRIHACYCWFQAQKLHGDGKASRARTWAGGGELGVVPTGRDLRQFSPKKGLARPTWPKFTAACWAEAVKITTVRYSDNFSLLLMDLGKPKTEPQTMSSCL